MSVDIDNNTIDEKLGEVFDSLLPDAKVMFKDLGLKLEKLRRVYKSLNWAIMVKNTGSSHTAQLRKDLIKSLRHDLEREATIIIISTAGNSILNYAFEDEDDD